MAKVDSIESNATGLSYAEEISPGVVDGSVTWFPLEPNSYTDFGGELTLTARKPINPSRQKKKGVITGLAATGGYNTDLTQENMRRLMQGFLFADSRKKNEIEGIATVNTGGSGDDFEPSANGNNYKAKDLLFAGGFSDTAANGLHEVTGTPTATSVPVTSSLPILSGESGTIRRVGFEFASGEADIDVSGTLPALETTTKDLTELGLIPGEFVFIGDDGASNQYDSATNNGYMRVATIATNRIEFDKTQATMVDDSGSGKSIRIFFGEHLRNELGALIKKKTYQLERTLGAPDDSNLSEIQSEYVVGQVPSEFSLTIPKSEMIKSEIKFVGTGHETRDGATGVKPGTRAALIEADAFNTADSLPLIKLAEVIPGNPNPTDLFAFVSDLSIKISNNVKPNEALGVLGAFSVSFGTFDVSGDLTAYFSDIAAINAVRENKDITLETHLAKANQGISYDIPLMSLGGGKPNISENEPITIPLNSEAATGAKIRSDLDYTLSVTTWDYLPTMAYA